MSLFKCKKYKANDSQAGVVFLVLGIKLEDPGTNFHLAITLQG